jgi:hypothetical protein
LVETVFLPLLAFAGGFLVGIAASGLVPAIAGFRSLPNKKRARLYRRRVARTAQNTSVRCFHIRAMCYLIRRDSLTLLHYGHRLRQSTKARAPRLRSASNSRKLDATQQDQTRRF